MADKRIDQLTAATSLGDSDLLVVEQSSTAKKATGTVVSNYINSKFGLSGMASDISTLQTAVAGKQDALTLPLPVAQGGTGATTAGNARVNLGLGTAATANIDTTLTIAGAAADAKAAGDAVGELKSAFNGDNNYSLKTNYKPVWTLDTVSGTQRVIINGLNIDPGTYLLNVDNITSSDTDGATSAIYFYYSDGDGSVKATLNRNTRIVQEVTFAKAVDHAIFFAGYNNAQSTGDSFTYSGFGIGLKPTEYRQNIGNYEKGTYINGTFTSVGSRVGLRSIQHFDNPSLLIPASDYNLRLAFFDDTGAWKWDINGLKGNVFIPAGTNLGISIYKDGSPTIPDTTNLYELFTTNLQILDASGFADHQIKAFQTNFSCMGIFPKIGVCGDSFASGSIYNPDGTWHGDYNLSWPQIMARESGVEAVNFSKGGLSTKTWLTDETWGLTKLLNTEAQNLYILAFGINDYTQIYGSSPSFTLGTIADINEDYTQNPETFYGCYGRIIGNIQTHAPNAKIVLLSVARYNERKGMDAPIKEIAEHFGIPYIYLPDHDYFISPNFYHGLVSAHPTPIGYGSMARAIGDLIIADIGNNPDYWLTYSGL